VFSVVDNKFRREEAEVAIRFLWPMGRSSEVSALIEMAGNVRMETRAC